MKKYLNVFFILVCFFISTDTWSNERKIDALRKVCIKQDKKSDFNRFELYDMVKPYGEYWYTRDGDYVCIHFVFHGFKSY